MAQLDVYIDCEFNGFNGYFISIALVPEDPTLPELYLIDDAVGERPVVGWVWENVMPVILLEGAELDPVCQYNNLRGRIASYLWQLHAIAVARGQRINIVCDWLSDPIHLFQLILDPFVGGQMISVPNFTVEFRRDMKKQPATYPHNALSDARAMARANR